jgi:hypothetical protein
VAYLPGGGDEIFAIIACKLKKVVSGEQIPTFLRVSKRLCMR